MRQVTLEDLRVMGEQARGEIDKIYLHWSASRYTQFFEDYHINIDGNGIIYVSTDDLTERKNHTYKRNTRTLGITLACCYQATSNDLGDYAPTEVQIETMSLVTALFAKVLDLPIDIFHVMTHGEAGDNEDGLDPNYESNGYEDGKYGPKNSVERWDLAILKNGDEWGSGGNILRGKANWYLESGQLP